MPLLDSDREFFARELDSFVPPRVFDAHSHLYRKSFFSSAVPSLVEALPEMGFQDFQKAIAEITPDRKTSGLFFGWPSTSIDWKTNNQFVAEQTSLDPNSRAQMLIIPTMDPEYIRETVRRYRFSGLKCYHVFSSHIPTFESPIPQYLPEEHVRIAHEEGLSITLHMVRARAMADRNNQEVLQSWAAKYPNARFILAHAARGFNPHHTIEGIGALQRLRNVWCDTSAVTEAGGFEAIVRTLGVDRLLYGGDAPVTHERGRCVAIGDSFFWMSAANTQFSANYAEIQPALIGHESLRALKLACWNLKLTDSEIEKIFFGNAAELYGLTA
jgi:predicted TIM-barrel fold metal-dependent hydrolase